MQLQGVRIRDLTERHVLAFDVNDILLLCKAEVQSSQWLVRVEECFGEGADDLQRLSADHFRISGQSLLAITSRIYQVVDGVFIGYWPGDPNPWLVVIAVDSTFYDVYSTSEQVLDVMKEHFRDIGDAPPWGPELES